MVKIVTLRGQVVVDEVVGSWCVASWLFEVGGDGGAEVVV